MSVQALVWVIEHSQSSNAGRLVMISLANHADRFGESCHPSVETIAREANLTIRRVQQVLPELEQLGEISINRGAGPHGTHAYTILALQRQREQGGEKFSLLSNRSPVTEEGSTSPGQAVAGGENFSPPDRENSSGRGGENFGTEGAKSYAKTPRKDFARTVIEPSMNPRARASSSTSSSARTGARREESVDDRARRLGLERLPGESDEALRRRTIAEAEERGRIRSLDNSLRGFGLRGIQPGESVFHAEQRLNEHIAAVNERKARELSDARGRH